MPHKGSEHSAICTLYRETASGIMPSIVFIVQYYENRRKSKAPEHISQVFSPIS